MWSEIEERGWRYGVAYVREAVRLVKESRQEERENAWETEHGTEVEESGEEAIDPDNSVLA